MLNISIPSSINVDILVLFTACCNYMQRLNVIFVTKWMSTHSSEYYSKDLSSET